MLAGKSAHVAGHGEVDLIHVADVRENAVHVILHREGHGLAGAQSQHAAAHKVDALHAGGAGVAGADVLVHDETVGGVVGVGANAALQRLLIGQAAAAQIGRAGSGLALGDLKGLIELIPREVVVADLHQAAGHGVAALLAVHVHRKVSADNGGLEQRGDGQLVGRAVPHEILHAVGLLGLTLEVDDAGVGVDLAGEAASGLHGGLVGSGAGQDVADGLVRAVGGHGVLNGQSAASARHDGGHGLNDAVAAELCADGQGHVVEGAVSGGGGHFQAGSIRQGDDELVADAALHVAVIHAAVQAEVRDEGREAQQIVVVYVEELGVSDALGEKGLGLKSVHSVLSLLICLVGSPAALWPRRPVP